jgi:hypothetical protein
MEISGVNARVPVGSIGYCPTSNRNVVARLGSMNVALSSTARRRRIGFKVTREI